MAAFPYPRHPWPNGSGRIHTPGSRQASAPAAFPRQIEALALSPLPGALAGPAPRSFGRDNRVGSLGLRRPGGGELWSLLDIDRRYRPNHWTQNCAEQPAQRQAVSDVLAENDSRIAPAPAGQGRRITGGVDALIDSMQAKLIGALLMKRHPLAGHALVKLELGNVIALNGHDPSGGGVIIGVKVFGPRGRPLFVELWEGTNEVDAGFDSLVYHGRIRRLRVRATDHRDGEV
jgi:hypothetical protein